MRVHTHNPAGITLSGRRHMRTHSPRQYEKLNKETVRSKTNTQILKNQIFLSGHPLPNRQQTRQHFLPQIQLLLSDIFQHSVSSVQVRL